jgi:hypothetical protein
MTTTHIGYRAIRITDAHIEPTFISRTKTVTAIQKAVGCDHFDLVPLDHGIDLYVDDEGAINGSPLNLKLTIMAHILGVPTVLFGNGIMLGGSDDNGDTVSLTSKQVLQIAEAMTRRLDLALIEQLAQSLGPLPQVVEYLRNC